MNNLFWQPRPVKTRTYFTLSDTIPGGNDKSAYWAKQLHQNFGQFFAPGLESAAEELNTPELTKLLQEYVYPRFYHEAFFYIDEYIDQVETPYQTSDEYQEVCGRIYSWALSTQQTYGELVKIYEAQRAHLLDDIKSTTTLSATSEGSNTGTNESTGSSTTTVNSSNSGTSNSITKNNDTPQILGDVEADKFVSGVSKNEGSNSGTSEDKTVGSTTNKASSSGTSKDTTSSTTSTVMSKDTMINRLDEINQKLVDIYNEWSNSFRQFIIFN